MGEVDTEIEVWHVLYRWHSSSSYNLLSKLSHFSVRVKHHV